jgi:hypothetical protein
MPTKISKQDWDGGGGGTSRYLCTVNEEPIDVLKFVYQTHNVYTYKDLYRPIDDSFPNNVDGLIIEEGKKEDIIHATHTIVLPSVWDIIACAKTTNKRNDQTITQALKHCEDWHIKGFGGAQLTSEENRRIAERRARIRQQLSEVAFAALGIPIPKPEAIIVDAPDWEKEAGIWKERFERVQDSRNELQQEVYKLRDQLSMIRLLASPSMPQARVDALKKKVDA